MRQGCNTRNAERVRILGLEGKSLKDVSNIVGVLEKGCKEHMPTAEDIKEHEAAIFNAKKKAAKEARAVAKEANIHAKKLEDEVKSLEPAKEEK